MFLPKNKNVIITEFATRFAPQTVRQWRHFVDDKHSPAFQKLVCIKNNEQHDTASQSARKFNHNIQTEKSQSVINHSQSFWQPFIQLLYQWVAQWGSHSARH